MAHMVHYVWSIELVGNRYGKLVCAVVFFNILLQSATLIFITSGYKKQAKFIYYFTSHLGHKNWMVWVRKAPQFPRVKHPFCSCDLVHLAVGQIHGPHLQLGQVIALQAQKVLAGLTVEAEVFKWRVETWKFSCMSTALRVMMSRVCNAWAEPNQRSSTPTCPSAKWKEKGCAELTTSSFLAVLWAKHILLRKVKQLDWSGESWERAMSSYGLAAKAASANRSNAMQSPILLTASHWSQSLTNINMSSTAVLCSSMRATATTVGTVIGPHHYIQWDF